MDAQPATDDLSALPQADQDVITRTLGSLLNGFSSRDADQLTDAYAVDADWVNQVGTVKRGGAEIVAYLRDSSPTTTSTPASWPARRRCPSGWSPTRSCSCRPT